MNFTREELAELGEGITEGPWRQGGDDRNEQPTVNGDNGRLVAVCAHECVLSLIPEAQANARLIEAAPMLLSDLQAAHELIERMRHCLEEIAEIDDAPITPESKMAARCLKEIDDAKT